MSAIAIAAFGDEGAFLRARLRAVTDGRRVLGEWAPYPPAGLAAGPAAEGGGGMLRAVIVAGAIVGAALFAFESWSAADYAFNSGGRPLWSWQAFLPSAIELAALGGAVAGMVLFFRRAGLTRLHDSAFDLDEVAMASDAFVLALGCDRGEDANAALALLAQAGATHSRLVDR